MLLSNLITLAALAATGSGQLIRQHKVVVYTGTAFTGTAYPLVVEDFECMTSKNIDYENFPTFLSANNPNTACCTYFPTRDCTGPIKDYYHPDQDAKALSVKAKSFYCATLCPRAGATDDEEGGDEPPIVAAPTDGIEDDSSRWPRGLGTGLEGLGWSVVEREE